MDKIFHSANTRGVVDYGWLLSSHTFSFGGYYNSERIIFGSLRVINDDVIMGGQGFDSHIHENMEIISIPLSGSLRHVDGLSNEFVIKQGDIQLMSAGEGIEHSEYNDSLDTDVKFLQIWVYPNVQNTLPAYDQKSFLKEQRQNCSQMIVSPDGREGSLIIKQDAYFNLCDLEKSKSIKYNINYRNNYLYVFLISGKLLVGSDVLTARDGLGILHPIDVNMRALESSEILLMEIPPL